jgi:hypothetical protein
MTPAPWDIKERVIVTRGDVEGYLARKRELAERGLEPKQGLEWLLPSLEKVGAGPTWNLLEVAHQDVELALYLLLQGVVIDSLLRKVVDAEREFHINRPGAFGSPEAAREAAQKEELRILEAHLLE